MAVSKSVIFCKYSLVFVSFVGFSELNLLLFLYLLLFGGYLKLFPFFVIILI